MIAIKELSVKPLSTITQIKYHLLIKPDKGGIPATDNIIRINVMDTILLTDFTALHSMMN